MNNMGSLTRQVQRGSAKSNEVVSQSARSFCQSESTMENTFNNLQRSQVLLAQLNHQQAQTEKSLQGLHEVQEQIRDMQR